MKPTAMTSNNNQSNLAINPANISQNPQQVSIWLKQGRILAYPTESVWGIGCDAYNEVAVHQLLTIKQRSIEKGLIVVTDSLERVQPLLVGLTTVQRQAIANSWQFDTSCSNKLSAQQATTWLLPEAKLHNIPDWLTGQHDSIAVRVIAHPLIQQLCVQMANPANPYGFIVSTSCNPAGQPPATSLIEAVAYFGKQVDYLQGAILGHTLPSQIKDALTGRIIR